VRIFTPTREIPFAGHPNIGTAFVLAQQAQAVMEGTFNLGSDART
jgi:predicted PhzF superfamily epimerase YddE/YHI9